MAAVLYRLVHTSNSRDNMPTELIQDFSEGINNKDAPNRLKPNQLATASNCWYDVNAIKARGAFKTGINTTNSQVEIGDSLYKLRMCQGATTINLNAATLKMFHFAQLSGSGAAAGGVIPIQQENPDVSGEWGTVSYAVGTVETTSGSAVVTGSGTSWTGSVRPGDIFAVSSKVARIVSTVDSNTQITLTATYTSTNSAGSAYKIWPEFTGFYPPSFEMVNNKVYMTSQSRMPAYWNGSNHFNNTNSPICLLYKLLKNYMFAANTSANPSRLSWSAIKDAETWPASNFIDIAPDDGDQITGLFNDGQSLIILKKRSIFRLTGDIFDPSNPTYVLTKLYTPPECIFESARSWAVFKGVVMLYGGVGFYQYDGGSAITRMDVTDNILGTINGTGWVPTNVTQIEHSNYGGGAVSGQQAITYNGNYWITSHQAAYGKILMLDRNLKWWIFNPPGANDLTFGFFIMKGSSPSTYNTLWTIIQNSSTTDSGTYILDQDFSNESINATFTTRVFQYAKKQRFGRAYLHFKRASTGSITFGYKVDEGTTVEATVDMTTGTGNRVKSPPIMIGRVGQAIQFVISHNASTEDFEVYAIEFERQDLRQ